MDKLWVDEVEAEEKENRRDNSQNSFKPDEEEWVAALLISPQSLETQLTGWAKDPLLLLLSSPIQ